MPTPMSGTSPLGTLVHALDRAAPGEIVAVCRDWLARAVGATGCTLLLADYGEQVLEPVPTGHGHADATPPHALTGGTHDVDGSAAGAAYREQRTVRVSRRNAALAYLPVTMRSERLGVLAVALPHAAVPDATTRVLAEVAQVLAYVLVGARRYTDRYETLRRRRDFGLAAEIQWELLPVLAYELPWLAIAGALEPTYDIGGDSFDYAVTARSVTVTIGDAVGHGLHAALLGSLAVTAMRNARRCSEPISGQAEAANRHLAEQFPGPSWVTGLLMTVDAGTGHGTLINAGHPPPLLLRGGAVEPLTFAPDPPLGLLPDTRYALHRLTLRPGDRLVLLTDGITEAHHVGGPFFGVDRVAELLTAHARLPAVEFVRLLTRAVVDHRDGELADDATAVCLDWFP